MTETPQFSSDEEWVEYHLLQAPPMTDDRWADLEAIIRTVRRDRAVQAALKTEAQRLARRERRERAQLRQALDNSSGTGTSSASAKA